MDDNTNAQAPAEAAPDPTLRENAITPDPAKANEPTSTENGPAQTSFTEKLNAAASPVFERFGINWKRGRGRARSDGQPKKSDVPLDVPASSVPVGAAPNSAAGTRAADSVLIRRSVTAMAKALTGSIDKILFRKAKAVTGDQNFARELVNETSATVQECDALAEVTDIIMAELGLQSKYLPLAAALTIVSGAGLRYSFAFKTLKELERKKPQPQKQTQVLP